MKCLIDLDGVLVDFNLRVAEILGVDVFAKAENHGRYWVNDILELTEKEFWDKIRADDPYSFWRNLPKTKEFDQILDAAFDAFGNDDVCIFTSPSSDSDSLKAKFEWISEHIPSLKAQFLIGKPKRFAAAPDTILIDDMDINIDQFKESGGIGILFPQYWNTQYQYYRDLHNTDDWAYKFLTKEITAAKEYYEK